MHATEIYDANLYSGLASLRSRARGNLRPYGKQRDSEFLYDPIIAIKEIDAGGLCNGTLVPSALKAVREKTHHQTVKIVFPEQSTDAVIYVTVVVVFYAAIILILVGTNIHRFRRTRAANGVVANGEIAEPKQQVVVRLDHKERAYQVSASPEEIKAEVENQETDGALV